MLSFYKVREENLTNKISVLTFELMQDSAEPLQLLTEGLAESFLKQEGVKFIIRSKS